MVLYEVMKAINKMDEIRWFDVCWFNVLCYLLYPIKKRWPTIS